MTAVVEAPKSNEIHNQVNAAAPSQLLSKPHIAAVPLPLESCEDVILCRPMKLEDYPMVRELIPQVSRCSEVYPSEVVTMMLQLPTFFPFVIENQSSNTIVGYAELHRLPHLGRGFDCRLEKVLVIECMRGLKLAKKACAYLTEVAKTKLHCGRVDLTVEKPDAKKVYSNLGFAKVETEVWRLMF